VFEGVVAMGALASHGAESLSAVDRMRCSQSPD
jgi:hypothetical protein